MVLTLKRVNLYLTRIRNINNYFMRLKSSNRTHNIKLYQVTSQLLNAEKELRELQKELVEGK